MTRTFVMTSEFDRSWQTLGLNDDDLKQLQYQLAADPDAGDIIPGTHGCRKYRISLNNRGKSGGARVIYVDFITFEKIYLIEAYAKSEKVNLSKQEYTNIKNAVKSLEIAERENYERRNEP